MEGGESLLDTIFDAEKLEDVDMLDAEEGELVENHQADLGQSSSKDVDAVTQESHSHNKNVYAVTQESHSHSKNWRRRHKKKHKKKKACSESDVTDINRFVLHTCKHLKEKKPYLVWTAVGCLGVSALSDLVKEVDAIQACGGQKTSDGKRHRTGGGILWSILKTRDPNAFKEIMKKGKEFEKQFKPFETRKVSKENKETPKPQNAETADMKHVCIVQKQNGNLNIEEREKQKRSVHDRIRVPVSYDDLVEVEDLKGISIN